MATKYLNQTQDISEQHQKENGLQMIPSLGEEEVDPGQIANSGTEVSQGAKLGTLVNLKNDQRVIYLRK